MTVRVIIAGTRNFANVDLLNWVMAGLPWVPTTIVCGCAPGADTLGEQWALARGLPVHRFPADWKAHGRAAGPKRNEQMAANADALVAFWDGASRGTAHMIGAAKDRRLRMLVHIYTVPLGPLNPKTNILVPPLPPGAPHA